MPPTVHVVATDAVLTRLLADEGRRPGEDPAYDAAIRDTLLYQALTLEAQARVLGGHVGEVIASQFRRRINQFMPSIFRGRHYDGPVERDRLS